MRNNVFGVNVRERCGPCPSGVRVYAGIIVCCLVLGPPFLPHANAGESENESKITDHCNNAGGYTTHGIGLGSLSGAWALMLPSHCLTNKYMGSHQGAAVLTHKLRVRKAETGGMAS